MPNKPKTQHRSVRIGDDEWRDLLAAATVQGTDRTGAINDLIAWYLRRPGATTPKRPDTGSWSGSACGAANYSDRCKLPTGHDGRHKDGNMSWPQGVERPVSPAISEERHG